MIAEIPGVVVLGSAVRAVTRPRRWNLCWFTWAAGRRDVTVCLRIRFFGDALGGKASWFAGSVHIIKVVRIAVIFSDGSVSRAIRRGFHE